VHTGAHAERLQALGGSRSEVVYLAEREGAIVEVDSCPFGPFARRGFQQAFERHRRGQWRIPRHALRIGFLQTCAIAFPPGGTPPTSRVAPVAGYFPSTLAGYTRAVDDGSD
jgi:hypothetical protein